MPQYAFERLCPEYTLLWARMQPKPERATVINRTARKLIAHKAQYQAVEASTGVPWFVIAALHNRESDADFDTYLGNGEPLDRVTKLVPKGRGPFASWEEGAIDALRLDGLDHVTDWSAERACYEIEKFNGFGYRNPARDIPSPYLWAGTNVQKPGKFVADGRYDPRALDEQLGAIPVLREIMALDPEASFATAAPPAAPAPEPERQPPRAPRADDTETQVKPLGKSTTVWNSIWLWLVANGASLKAFIKEDPWVCVAIAAISILLLWMIVSGRLTQQKIMKHLSQDDTA